MKLALFEDGGWRDLLPLTYLRAAFELRIGRDRLVDKIQKHLGRAVSRIWVRESIAQSVQRRVSCVNSTGEGGWCLVNARAFVTADVTPPPLGTAWVDGESIIAATISDADAEGLTRAAFDDPMWAVRLLAGAKRVAPPAGVKLIRYPWEPALANASELARQCGEAGIDGKIYAGAVLLNELAIYVGFGAMVKPGAVLDAEDGPIHIESDVLIEPNCMIQGPCFIGRGSIIRCGAAIRHGTSIGPVCKVGGEIEASTIHGYSNKQHDGFLGHSYVSEWVNLGADTVTSDLKNTYGTIRVSLNGRPVETGERFVGSIIGDHAKTGIGTILPTGCVLGVAANVFTRRPVPKFVPSFAWVTDDGVNACVPQKTVEVARTVMARRKIELGPDDERLLHETVTLARSIEAAGWESAKP